MPGLLDRFSSTPPKPQEQPEPQPGTLTARFSDSSDFEDQDQSQQQPAIAEPPKTLPDGAIDWDANGDPYFGEGLSAILKKWKYNYTKDIKPVSEDDWQELRDRWNSLRRQAHEAGSYAKASPERTSIAVQQSGVVMDAASKLWQAGTAQGSVLSPVLKGIGATVTAIGDLFSIPAQKVEQALGAGMGLQQAALTIESPLPRLDENALTQAINLTPFGYTYDWLRIAMSPQENKWDITAKKIEEGWQSGRILYSTVFDHSLKAKYLAEYREGKDPGLIAIKLQNPWAELGGQLLLDPLNLVGAFTKSAKTAKQLDAATNAVTASGVLKTEAGRAALEAMAKATDDISGARALDNLVAAQTDVVNTIQKNSKLLNVGYSVDSLTTTSRQNAIVGKGKDLLGNMALVLRERGMSEDGVAEAILSGIRSVSTNADEMRKGLSGLAKLPNANMWLSDDYVESFVVLRNMMADSDGIIEGGRIRKLTEVKDPAAFAEEVQKLYLSAVKDQFHEIDDIEKAYRTVKQADRIGQSVDDEVRALAARWDSIPNHARYANKINNALKKVTSPMNRILFPAYFNLQGGVAVRNVITNMELVLIDKGPSAWLKDGKYWSLDNVEKYIKGIYGAMPDAAHGFKSLVSSMTDRPAWGFGKWMEKGEEAAATRIVGAAIRDTFKKMLPKAMPNLAPHVEKGVMTQRQAANLMRLIERNGYDVRKAVEDFRDLYKVGSVEDWRNLDFVTDFEKSALEELDLWKDIDDLARKGANDPSEVEAVVNKLKEVIDTRMKEATKDIPGLSPDHPGVDSWGDLVKASEDGHLDPDDQILFTAVMEAAEQARLEYQSLLDDVVLKATQTLNDAGRGMEAQQLGQEMNRVRDVLRKAAPATAREAHEVTQDAWRWTEEIKRIRKSEADKLANYWTRVGLQGPPPADLSKRTLLKELWAQRFEKVSDLWNSSFEAIVNESETVLQQMAGIVDTAEIEAMAARTRHITQQAQAIRKGVFKNGALKIIPLEDLEKIAKRAGVTLEEALEVINKRKGENYASVEELPTRDILAAFRELRIKKGLTTLDDKLTLAKQHGITEPNHLINAVNKYLDLEEGQKYTRIEDIPYATIRDALVNRKSAKAAEATKTADAAKTASTGKPLTAIYEETTKVPRSELSQEASDEFARVARELQRELGEGQPGKRISGNQLEGRAERVVQSSTNADWYRKLYQEGKRKPAIDKALEKIIKDNGLDKGKTVETVKEVIVQRIAYGDPAAGIPPNVKVLQELGADESVLQRAVDDYNEITHQNLNLDDLLAGKITEDNALAMTDELTPDPTRPYFDENGNLIEPTVDDQLLDPTRPYFDENGNLVEPGIAVPPPHPTGTQPSPARVWYENGPAAKSVLDNILEEVKGRWGKTNPERKPDAAMNAVLEDVAKTMEPRIAEMKAVALRIAKEQRDFALLNYGERTYGDIAKAYIFPFHFFYTRSYKNWISRLATNPQLVAGYGKYKNALEGINRDLPDWYKQQLNINPFAEDEESQGKTFLGIPLDHPLYINLESTFNPLYGLTGTDYNDPQKRANWALATIDDMGKFGPTIYAPIQMAIAAYLFKQGETDVAARWGSRLFPQTTQIKALTSTLFGKPVELDPAVNLFSDGIDPQERGRMAYAAAQLIQSGQFTPEDVMLQFQQQEGPAWDAAYQMAVQSRAASSFTSYFLGVGFKPRSVNDVKVEEMYTQLNKLYASADFMSPEDYRMAWEQLRSQYPDGFVDTVLLAKKGGDKRDAALAYEVLNRLPPGNLDDALAVIGISQKEIDKFYKSKGFTDPKVKFTKTEKDRFMAAVIDMAAMLKIPDTATRQDWMDARTAYSQVYKDIEDQLGEEIWDKVSLYYDLKDDNYQEAQQFGNLHPEIFQAIQMKREAIVGTPILSAYYGSLETIETYLDGKIRQQLTDKYGPDIYAIQSGYFEADNPRAYLAQYPQLKQFWNDKRVLDAQSDKQFQVFASKLPEGRGVQFQEGFAPETPTQEALYEALQPQSAVPTWDEVSQGMPDWFQQEITNYATYGTPLSKRGQKEADYLAKSGDYYDTQSFLRIATLALTQGMTGQEATSSGLLSRFGP